MKGVKQVMNKQQKAYAAAKAAYDALKDAEREIVRNYISKHGIVNEDGSTPSELWMIDDDTTFEAACAEIGPLVDALGIDTAQAALEAAEDALINYGLSIVPFQRERETLRNRCFGLNGQTVLLNIREKVIDLAFRLDTRTVRA